MPRFRLNKFLSIPTIAILWIYGIWSVIGISIVFQSFWPGSGIIYRSVNVFLLVPVFSFYCSIPFLRYINRLFPFRSDFKRRYGCVVFLTIIGLLWGVLMFITTALEYIQSKPPDMFGDLSIAGMSGFILVACILLFYTYMYRARKLPSAYLLYLRRFSSFSDREVIGTILRNLKPGVPIVILVTDRATLNDWDPRNIGIAGYKFRKPISSMPFIIRAENSEWESCFINLIKNANAVAIDVSDFSESIMYEYNTIRESVPKERRLVFAETGTDTNINNEETILPYSKSWKRALPRIIVVSIIFVAMISWLFYTVFKPNSTVNHTTTQQAETLIAGLGGSLIYIIPLLRVMVFRASVDKDFVSGVKQFLRRVNL